MFLFTRTPYRSLGSAIVRMAGMQRGDVTVERFPNGEYSVTLQEDVKRASCAILAPLVPSDDAIFVTALLGHTLREQGAQSIVGIFPYISYLRQHRIEPGKSIASQWMGELLQAAGFDEVVTIDPHNSKAPDLFPLSMKTLSAAPLFAKLLPSGPAAANTIIVAPDAGALCLCSAVGAGRPDLPIISFSKQRTRRGVSHSQLPKFSARQALVIDDMLDTGGTLVSCCQHLRKHGVRDITVMVTHGLFTGTGWQRLFKLGVKRLYCTNTLPLPSSTKKFPIKTISVAPLIREYVLTRPSATL